MTTKNAAKTTETAPVVKKVAETPKPVVRFANTVGYFWDGDAKQGRLIAAEIRKRGHNATFHPEVPRPAPESMPAGSLFYPVAARIVIQGKYEPNSSIVGVNTGIILLGNFAIIMAPTEGDLADEYQSYFD